MTAPTSTNGPKPVAAAADEPESFSSRVRIDVGALSHVGLRRANNEDHFLVAKVGRTWQTLTSSLHAGDVPDHTEEVNYVLVVADGMGGHAAGEVASRMAISSLIKMALESPDWILRVDEGYAAQIAKRSKSRLKKVGAMLVEEGKKDPSLKGMGTTLTLARSLGRDLMITHVGDSRAYLLRRGRLHHLTRDHTYAQLLVDIGELDASALSSSKHRHVLTNALGGTSEDVQVDSDRVQLVDGDRVLLCSDGLTDMVEDDVITKILSEAASADEACERLIKQALDAGGRDNVTVVVALYQLPKAEKELTTHR
jgi:serine/threonine protein phosphatase PrpC